MLTAWLECRMPQAQRPSLRRQQGRQEQACGAAVRELLELQKGGNDLRYTPPKEHGNEEGPLLNAPSMSFHVNLGEGLARRYWVSEASCFGQASTCPAVRRSCMQAVGIAHHTLLHTLKVRATGMGFGKAIQLISSCLQESSCVLALPLSGSLLQEKPSPCKPPSSRALFHVQNQRLH